jgi:outer membrane protein
MTRKFALCFLSVVLVFVLGAVAQTTAAAAPAPAAAAATTGPPPTKIGIINIQQAIIASNEGRRDLEALQKKFEPKQTELSSANKEVEALKTQLNTQGDKLNDDARGTLVKSIESKQKSLQRSVEDAQNEFQGQQNEIANRIGGKMLQVLDNYAKSNGFAVILDVSSPQSPVLWASAPVDVTKAIVDAYNAQSGVPAPPPGSTTAAPAKPGVTPKPTPGSKPVPPPPATTPKH